MSMKQIAVLLADDHQIVREGFRSLLGHEPDIEMVGEAANGREAVQLIRKLRPVGLTRYAIAEGIIESNVREKMS